MALKQGLPELLNYAKTSENNTEPLSANESDMDGKKHRRTHGSSLA